MKSVLACCAENEPHASDSVLMTGVCGHKVWVSQSGLQAMREMDLEVSCIACLPPDIPVVGHAGIKKEVEKVIGKEAAESIMAELQDPVKLNLLILASRLFKKRNLGVEVEGMDLSKMASRIYCWLHGHQWTTWDSLFWRGWEI